MSMYIIIVYGTLVLLSTVHIEVHWTDRQSCHRSFVSASLTKQHGFLYHPPPLMNTTLGYVPSSYNSEFARHLYITLENTTQFSIFGSQASAAENNPLFFMVSSSRQK